MIEILRTKYKQIRIGHGGTYELRTPEGIAAAADRRHGLELFRAVEPRDESPFRARVSGLDWIAYGPGTPPARPPAPFAIRAGSEATEAEALAAAIRALDELRPMETNRGGK
jgi:hypothetical protein